ncbi:pentapeptide repeat-containing protein [Okeania sp.]|uniref:pentapeptide repeat-containing protein n=1 Tax=Okeania sp. TaxID=3100323 RepID=UPI002B4B1765|nr:pentapeptide repeat-containing protein [Okeania sp.]MEB3341222.1 pentapeptide repeat-containing protein [Okeania sp.]
MDQEKFLEQHENVERDFSRRQIEDNFSEQYENGERDFSGIDLRKCYFFDALLMDINLSGASLESAFIEGHIGNANFSRANLKKASLRHTYFIGTNLSYANLSGANLICADFTNSDLSYANLSGANLDETQFIGSNLTNANLTDIKIPRDPIVHYSTRPDGKLIINPSRGLDAQKLLSRYAAGERNFEKAILHGVDLSGAELRDVNLFCAHFSNCNLSNATLSGDWNGSQFINCDFRGAKLDCELNSASFIYVDMREATICADTTCTHFIEVNFQDAELRCSGESLAFFHNITLKDGFFLQGSSNYPVRANKNIEKLL